MMFDYDWEGVFVSCVSLVVLCLGQGENGNDDWCEDWGEYQLLNES